jgi:hypothetical protein
LRALVQSRGDRDVRLPLDGVPAAKYLDFPFASSVTSA